MEALLSSFPPSNSFVSILCTASDTKGSQGQGRDPITQTLIVSLMKTHKNALLLILSQLGGGRESLAPGPPPERKSEEEIGRLCLLETNPFHKR